MNKDHPFSKREELLRQLRGSTAGERRLHRMHSVALVIGGLLAKDASALLGDSPRSIAYWVKRFEEKGVVGLEDKQSSGRKPTLSAGQLQKVRAFVVQTRTRGNKMSNGIVARFIWDSFGVKLTLRQCTRIINAAS